MHGRNMIQSIGHLTSELIEQFKRHDKEYLFTVAISGIDASGKGYVSKCLEEGLADKGYRVANINIDPWQTPLAVRLQKETPAENIYENIFRWDDFFEQLIFPLQKNKSIYLETKGIRSDADIYYPMVYDYTNIDILLIDGILLLKRKYLSLYDLKIWIDCSFEKGLERAIKRNVEKLEELKLIHDYHTFYYAAQRYHIEKDDPKGNAGIIYLNDADQ